jgi:hypothetical protein
MCEEQIISLITLGFTVLSTIILILISIWGPKNILVRQMYSDLLMEFRSPDFGTAIYKMIKFYNEECNSMDSNIVEKYIELFNKEIKRKNPKTIEEMKNTLHFYRRSLFQYYRHLADLRYSGNIFTKISKKQMKMFFSINDSKLMYMIYIIETDALPRIISKFDIEYLKKLGNTETSITNNFKRLFEESKLWKG